MEGIFDTVLLFIGLRVLLGQKSKEKRMGKGNKQRKKGKRSRWQEEADDQLTVKNLLLQEEKPKKPFENIKLPPPREAQSKPE